jgi:hypothetical protein
MAPQTALRSAGQRTEVCWTRKESGRWTLALAWIGLWCPLYEYRGMRGGWSRGPVSVSKTRTDPACQAVLQGYCIWRYGCGSSGD